MATDNNERNTESIFNNTHQDIPIVAKEVPLPTTAPSSQNLMENLMNKLIKTPKDKQLADENKEIITKFIDENKDFLEALVKYKFYISMQADGFIILSPDKKMSGKVTFKKDNVSEFDDNAKILFKQLATLMVNDGGLEDMIDSYEKDNFYPVGELEKETIMYKGKETEVMSGTLMNPQHETKKVYFYRGKEVFPD